MLDRAHWPPGVIGVQPHDMKPIKNKKTRFSWLVCRHCGLVGLRNEATAKALKQGCFKWADEP